MKLVTCVDNIQTHILMYFGLNKPHLCFDDIAPIMHQLAHHPEVSSQLVGHSFNGTPIYRLSVGHGPLVVLGWTQMHGDEPTATAAVLDWLSLLVDQPEFSPAEAWQHQCTIHTLSKHKKCGGGCEERTGRRGTNYGRWTGYAGRFVARPVCGQRRQE